MRKIFYLLIVLIFCCISIGFSNPSNAFVSSNIINASSIKKVQSTISNNQIDKTINILKEFSLLDSNNIYIKDIIIKNKNIILEYANNKTKQNKFYESLDILNFINRYLNEAEITQKINYNNSKIYNAEISIFNGNVEHIFTHCLLSDPSVALSPKNPMFSSYNIDCITPSEFTNVLKELHKNNYILIDIYEIFKTQGSLSMASKFYFPANKKPLIFSFDDVNYDTKKMNKGMVDKIMLDKNGNLCTYTKNAKTKTSYNNEFIVIMENFIKTHPDFSYNGAKGVICLTGYDGILGYRTQKNNPDYLSEINKATPIINKIKLLNWKFASHSYGHYHMKKMSLSAFNSDVKKWKDEVSSIVGDTSIYVYPYGEWDVFDNKSNISAKHQTLIDNGFKIFCGVGSQQFFRYLPNKNGNKVLFMDRTPIDGFTLKNRTKALSRFFNAGSVYDYKYRPK